MEKIRQLFILFFIPILLVASTPRVRTFSEFSDFSRAKLSNISVLAEGRITLGSQQKILLDTGDPYIWSVAADKKGNAYLGTGNDGRVYRVSAKGDSDLFFDAQEPEVYALAVDDHDNLYAATSPKGKVYKIEPNGRATVFFEPKENYIWALAWDANQQLLVATGDKAKVYRVSTSGRAEELFSLPQLHVRSLAVDKNNVIYAGSSGKGYVYRLEPGKPAFLLFDTQLEEVPSLVLLPTGTLMAAACGESAGNGPGDGPIPVRTRSAGQSAESAESGAPEVSLGALSLTIESQLGANVETSLFRIDANGYGKNIWNQPDEQVLVMARDDKAGVLAGTGKHGKLYRVLESGEICLILTTDAGQISAIAQTGDKRQLLATSNPGLCYVADDAGAGAGWLESEAIDAGMLSSWGVLSWQGRTNNAGVQFSTRSGNAENPASSWSEWQPVQAEGDVYRIASPVSRFLQFKCAMKSPGGQKPVVDEISVSYIQNNRAPEILAVMVYPQNDFYSPDATGSDKSGKSGLVYPIPLGKSEKKKGWRTAHWLFEDANLDGLSFSVFYQRENDKTWCELAKELTANIYAWDSSQMADGSYTLKVSATDRLSMPEDLALSVEKESDLFIIDNSGPEITFLPSSDVRQVRCRILDRSNRIDSIEYSLNAQGWNKLYPIDGLCDARQEQILVNISKELRGQVQVAIKVSDAAGNYQVGYTMVKVSE